MSGIFVYTGIVGFLAGVFVRSIFSVPFLITVFIGCAGVAGLCAYLLLRQKTHAFFAALPVFLVFVSFGIVRADISMTERPNFLDKRIGHTVLEGVVVDEPNFSERSQQLTLAVREGDEMARVRIVADIFPEYTYGDVVSVSGFLKKPENFETDTGRVFDYVRYLRKDGITHTVLFPEIELVSQGGGNVLYRVLFAARRKFIDTLITFLPEPDAGLLSGIAIGASDGMDKQTEEMFRRVGLIHITVLSGYNITVVADVVMRALSFLPRAAILSGGGVIIVLFVVATGASATAVRAGAMALLALAARFLGARYDIVRALFFVALAMVLWNPYVLVFDPSFQLSFLATLGLITLSPILEKKFKRITNLFSLRQTLSATLATQVFVLPLLIFMSGHISVVSVLANILVLPAVPPAMFFASILGIVGNMTNALGVMLSFFAVAVSRYILTVSEWLSRVPFASAATPALSAPAVLLVYALYALVFMLVKVRTTRSASSSSPH